MPRCAATSERAGRTCVRTRGCVPVRGMRECSLRVRRTAAPPGGPAASHAAYFSARERVSAREFAVPIKARPPSRPPRGQPRFAGPRLVGLYPRRTHRPRRGARPPASRVAVAGRRYACKRPRYGTRATILFYIRRRSHGAIPPEPRHGSSRLVLHVSDDVEGKRKKKWETRRHRSRSSPFFPPSPPSSCTRVPPRVRSRRECTSPSIILAPPRQGGRGGGGRGGAEERCRGPRVGILRERGVYAGCHRSWKCQCRRHRRRHRRAAPPSRGERPRASPSVKCT